MEGKKECVGGYYRIRKGKDPKAVHEALQKGYGIKHPERINGYSGVVFGTGDVFVSEAVGRRMSGERFRKFVFDSLMMFGREKYGEISNDDEELNGENRWLGNGDYVFGRYGYTRDDDFYYGNHQYDEIIRIRMWKGNIWITYESEMDLFLLLKDNGDDPGTVVEDLPCEEED